MSASRPTSSRPTPRVTPLRALVGVAAAVVLLATACGDDEPADTTSSTTTSESSTTSAPADPTAADAWARNAGEFRERVGETVDVECPAPGTLGTVWGANVYTDDSSICSAAVHAGLITVEEGGDVTIEILEGQDEYVGVESNGVTSQDYGSWPGSFSFPDAEPLDVADTIAWDRPANFYADRDEATFTVDCEANGTPGAIWGTEVYTQDSSICTAALHDGRITVEDGGEVTFELTGGQDSYRGSEANGVTSQDYGAYDGSFRFTD